MKNSRWQLNEMSL